MENYEDYRKFAAMYTNVHAIPINYTKVDETIKIKQKSGNVLTASDGNRRKDTDPGSKVGISNLSFMRSNSDNENIMFNSTPKSKKEELKKWISRL
jgi:hypothetical protein